MNHRILAENLAAQSMVLLKNEGKLLPFSQGQKAAFFGRAQLRLIFSGNGSGAVRMEEVKGILEECEARGIRAEEGLKAFYREQAALEAGSRGEEPDWSNPAELVNSGLMYEIFGRYHEPTAEADISEAQVAKARSCTDTAVLVLGRDSGGEECDRHLEGDYGLTDSEQRLVDRVCRAFPRVVLILNVNGMVDLSWSLQYPGVKSILFVGIPGQEGAAAIADILTGRVNPSGKLAFTIAEKYTDYPSAEHFSWDKEHPEQLLTYESYGLDARENGSVGFEKSPVTVYLEDIYAGYRYFDSFGVEPLFPFGYGLSYTEFRITLKEVTKKPGGAEIAVTIANTGPAAGREVVQLYLSAEGTGQERAVRELKGFEKTGYLEPGEGETLKIWVDWKELAVYEEERAAYIIGPGTYRFLVGNSSRDTVCAAEVTAEQEITVRHCGNRLRPASCNEGKLSFLSRGCGQQNGESCECRILLEPEDLAEVLREDMVMKAPAEQGAVTKSMSVEQLAALCVGYGPGVPFSAFGDGKDPATICDKNGIPLTRNDHPTGFQGYVSPAVPDLEIHSVFYKDGPAGIGETAWPTEMLIACAFDRRLWYAFGDAVGRECEKQQVDVWLAPAVNLHRHPLGGRNFEYFSEDPYLTGACACAVARGVQENHSVLVCPKHFALNEQETFRRGNAGKNYDAADSIVRERAARELYLKPFEMLVKEAEISCIMTSFNKINGVFAGGNRDLCTHILREEWGYQGAVITDWGDMDVVVDGGDAVAAGNDIVMPGGPPVIAQILKAHREGRVKREVLEAAVGRLLAVADRARKTRIPQIREDRGIRKRY